MPKVVIDANVWISSLLSDGNARRLRNKVEEGAIQLFCTQELLEECRTVLGRTKFASRIDPLEAAKLVELIRAQAIFVDLPEQRPPVSRDPSDDMYLYCAEAAACDFVVTGDADLLSLSEYRGTRIVSPVQFLDHFKAGL